MYQILEEKSQKYKEKYILNTLIHFQGKWQ